VLLKAPAEQKLLLLEKYANRLVGVEETKKQFLNMAGDIYSAYQSVLPDPEAEDYYKEVTAIRVIAARIRDVSEQNIDVTQVKRDLEDLLDKSIQAGEYVIPQHKKVKDLSMLDADALQAFFAKLENKNMQVESMKGEIEQKITAMVKRNKTRLKFMDRLNSLLEMYNSGAHDIHKLFDELVDLARDLNEEEQRAVKEHLTEEELAIFDLLLKENLNPDETEKIRKVAKELLQKLKREKLVLDWREKEATRAGVKITISKIVWNKLPEPTYSEQDCTIKENEVYNFIYEHYLDAEHFVAA
jgi:type I restriction enzyme R subunit